MDTRPPRPAPPVFSPPGESPHAPHVLLRRTGCGARTDVRTRAATASGPTSTGTSTSAGVVRNATGEVHRAAGELCRAAGEVRSATGEVRSNAGEVRRRGTCTQQPRHVFCVACILGPKVFITCTETLRAKRSSEQREGREEPQTVRVSMCRGGRVALAVPADLLRRGAGQRARDTGHHAVRARPDRQLRRGPGQSGEGQVGPGRVGEGQGSPGGQVGPGKVGSVLGWWERGRAGSSVQGGVGGQVSSGAKSVLRGQVGPGRGGGGAGPGQGLGGVGIPREGRAEGELGSGGEEERWSSEQGSGRGRGHFSSRAGRGRGSLGRG